MRKIQIKMVLFDLDGTLLPMDLDKFNEEYFKLLAQKVAPYGFEPGKMVKAIWHGTDAMFSNDGSCTNEERFWKDFEGIYGKEAVKSIPVFESFYANEYQRTRAFCGYNPKAAEMVHWIKEQGLRTALATNPLYPGIATEMRIRWTGLEPEAFEFITTYENIGWSKPNPNYFREVLRWTGLTAEECLMVGNDVEEDMVAETLGMKVFLLTDCLINKAGKDISIYPHGDFDELKAYVKTLITP